MVVASPSPIRSKKIRELELPVIDIMGERSEVSKLIVEACEEFGFFKVINHGVPEGVINRMEHESMEFFKKPGLEKQLFGRATNPYSYGSKNIGFNGDVGEVEYLLINTKTISTTDPTTFSSAVRSYQEAVRGVACEILELMAEGLGVPDNSVFSSLIGDVDSDSLLRLNHYPPLLLHLKDRKDNGSTSSNNNRIGFGEHSDPQILTILRSNGVAGLQISTNDGAWVPVTPDPIALCVNVGDVLQAMTNERFVSVRHRALANSNRARMSMACFCGPPLHARISSLPELITPERPPIYRAFTWAEYKKVTYSLRLGDSRLNLFKSLQDDEIRD